MTAIYKRVNEFYFKDLSGDISILPVPKNLNQDFLKRARPEEYLVIPFAAGRPVVESEVTSLTFRGSKIGFLIPGQALLSDYQGLNSDPFFGTYSLIAANKVCADSQRGEYTLSATSPSDGSTSGVFHQGVFYLVVWLAKIGITEDEFHKSFFVCLARNGVFPYSAARQPSRSPRTLHSYNCIIGLFQNDEWPDYIRTIVSELSPFASDPFLRFFYVYQVIETLMSINFKNQLAKVRETFDQELDLSITQLKEYVDKFQKIYKERTRINNALQPISAKCVQSAEAVLDALGEKDPDLTFADMVYKVRNIVFHDYQRVHPHASLVADLEEDLMTYILDEKLR